MQRIRGFRNYTTIKGPSFSHCCLITHSLLKLYPSLQAKDDMWNQIRIWYYQKKYIYIYILPHLSSSVFLCFGINLYSIGQLASHIYVVYNPDCKYPALLVILLSFAVFVKIMWLLLTFLLGFRDILPIFW